MKGLQMKYKMQPLIYGVLTGWLSDVGKTLIKEYSTWIPFGEGDANKPPLSQRY